MQTAVRLLPAQSIKLKRRKHDTGMKYFSAEKERQTAWEKKKEIQPRWAEKCHPKKCLKLRVNPNKTAAKCQSALVTSTGNKRQVSLGVNALRGRSDFMTRRLTPGSSARYRRLHIHGYGRECPDGDGEDEAHRQGHHPDLSRTQTQSASGYSYYPADSHSGCSER